METSNYIAGELSAQGSKTFKTFNPTLIQELDGVFTEATETEIDLAIEKAQEAFEIYRHIPSIRRADFLRSIAEQIEALGDELFDRYCAESGLPRGRAQGECARTVFQLRTFADHIEEGSYVEASIDHGDVDLRKMMIPIGPIAVFGASNFPLAYSTAGGDTASALAAGCPVIVKSHPMHAGTGNLIAGAVTKAAQITGMPKGVFSNLNSRGIEVGQQVVLHPGIKGVGFTGSIAGGRALYNLAATRKEPIPVFAEMGSINPVVVLPSALHNDRSKWIEEYVGSIALGAGQFCTNPGLILALENERLDGFVSGLAEGLNKREDQVMLHPNIASNYENNRRLLSSQDGVIQLTHEDIQANLLVCSGRDFLKNPNLHTEVFGPSSLVVRCATRDELNMVIKDLEGQLTGTILAGDLDLIDYSDTVAALQGRVGRIIFNGVPTGVAVSPSMVHGGPYPASSDARFTAVGIESIKRWIRPFSYQNWPSELLPDALQDDNPLGIIRREDGKMI